MKQRGPACACVGVSVQSRCWDWERTGVSPSLGHSTKSPRENTQAVTSKEHRPWVRKSQPRIWSFCAEVPGRRGQMRGEEVTGDRERPPRTVAGPTPLGLATQKGPPSSPAKGALRFRTRKHLATVWASNGRLLNSSQTCSRCLLET